jgi:hypothetical protein
MAADSARSVLNLMSIQNIFQFASKYPKISYSSLLKHRGHRSSSLTSLSWWSVHGKIDYNGTNIFTNIRAWALAKHPMQSRIRRGWYWLRKCKRNFERFN